jgi:long-chain fatty acid transport protein
LKLKITNLILLSVIMMGTLYAGGFQLNEHGARAMGLGGAFTAVADDPSAVYFNGAGLTQLEGWNFMVGTALIAPSSSFRGVAPQITEYKTSPQIFVIPNGYATYRINRDWAVSLGVDVPFGLATEWPLNWPGRYLALQTDVRAYTISADVAYKLLNNLSLSAGLQYSRADVTITEQSPQTPFPGDAYVKLTGKDNAAFGYKFGILYKPIDRLSFGASFHSQIKYDFKGSALTTGATQLASEFPAGNISANITTPLNFTVGAAYEIIPELRISADYQYVGWSSYDTLAIDFANVPRIASPRLYDNSYIIRFGAEYKYSRDLSFQGGIYYDNNPVKPEFLNPSLPDANRICFSLGLNYKFTSNFSAGASYLFIRGSELTVTNSKEFYSGNTPFNGTYNSYANLGSISLLFSL